MGKRDMLSRLLFPTPTAPQQTVHAGLYQKALDNIDSPQEVDYYVCSVCGHTVEKEPPDQCPVCSSKAKAFFKVD